MQTYDDKGNTYFRHARREIEIALPEHCGRVLELGCGAGATLEWLRDRPGTTSTTGVEQFKDAASQALRVADEVYCLDFENAQLPAQLPLFDTILCLDVLEHMVDPWKVVDRLVRGHLRPGGSIVVTLPNIRHHTIVMPLLLKGRWDYADAGILDRTHLRFFTRKSAVALLEHEELGAIDSTALSFSTNPLKRAINNATLRMFEGLLTPQYLLSARKRALRIP